MAGSALAAELRIVDGDTIRLGRERIKDHRRLDDGGEEGRAHRRPLRTALSRFSSVEALYNVRGAIYNFRMNPPNHISRIFRALSDKTRVAILLQLKAEGEQPVGRLAERFPIMPPAITRHLKVLNEAGLIERRVDRQRRMIRLCPEAIDTVQAWIASLGHPSA